jgi:DNA-3-methyladenine glycosylase I
MSEPLRCQWCLSHPLYIQYHDEEWGVPVRDDQALFEMLNLEGAQAGLSWWTVLSKRENYRVAFDQFDPEKIVRYDEAKITELLQNPGIIRNKLKVRSVVSNAQAYLNILEQRGSFSDYLWQFTEGKTIRNAFQSIGEHPAKTPISDAMSKDLKKKGFKFVGSTICYAFMQACGMVNDHIVGCFRYSEV